MKHEREKSDRVVVPEKLTSARGRSSTSYSGPASPRRSEATTLVFAFGSNLDIEQMHRRCGGVDVEGIAILPGYRLVFAGWSARWRGAVATILPSAAGRVPGVLYRVSRAGLDALDRFEGVPTVYERTAVRVFDADERWRRAQAYRPRVERAHCAVVVRHQQHVLLSRPQHVGISRVDEQRQTLLLR